MWKSSDKKSESVLTAIVAYSDGVGVQLYDTKGGTAAVQYLPYGVQSVPPEGVKAAAAEINGRIYMLGVEGVLDKPLDPGEVALFSAGGASIVLKNDGNVYINGRLVV